MGGLVKSSRYVVNTKVFCGMPSSLTLWRHLRGVASLLSFICIDTSRFADAQMMFGLRRAIPKWASRFTNFSEAIRLPPSPTSAPPSTDLTIRRKPHILSVITFFGITLTLALQHILVSLLHPHNDISLRPYLSFLKRQGFDLTPPDFFNNPHLQPLVNIVRSTNNSTLPQELAIMAAPDKGLEDVAEGVYESLDLSRLYIRRDPTDILAG